MKAKKIFMIGAFSTISLLGNAQIVTHTHDWSLSYGSNWYESGEGIVASSDGHVFSTGIFDETVDFSPLFTDGEISSNGYHDVYINKHDDLGNFEWVISFGGGGYDEVAAIDLDSESNVYVTGRFYGTVDFNPSPVASFNMHQGGSVVAAVYICKFDKSGNFVWAKSLEGSNELESTDITIDNEDNVHVTGSFSGQVDVNPAPSIFGVHSLTSAGPSDQDGFSVTLNQSGQYLKSYHLKGSASNASINGVALDPLRNQFFTGEFTGTCDFDQDASTFNMTSTGLGSDAFVMRVDPFNVFQIASQLKTSVSAHPKSIKLDDSQNVYTMGTFSGNIDLDPSSQVELHSTSNLKTSVYVSKLYMGYAFIYGKTISGHGSISSKGNVYGEDLDVTSDGKAYFTGSFSKTVDFKPGVGTKIISAVSTEDAFICGLNTAGNLSLVNTIEPYSTSYYAKNMSISVDDSENIYTTGRFSGHTDFNPSGTPFDLYCNYGPNLFIHKLKKVQVPFNPYKSTVEANSSTEFQIDVYPNPTANFVNLNFSGEESAKVLMYSASGKLVYSADHKSGTSSISLESLSEGAYILQITQGENTERIKVIKR